MGVYWKFVAFEEGSPFPPSYLSPVSFGENIKRPYDCPKTLRAVALLASFGSWKGRQIRLISDASGDTWCEFYYDVIDKGRDSTSEANELLIRFA